MPIFLSWVEGHREKRRTRRPLGFPGKSIDSCRILCSEEIEAPMWVDLTLEAQSTDKDIEDAWFQTSHPFHQSSSHELISMFSPSCEGKMKSPDFHCPDPKLPSSVSRSRGKHYGSRKWKEGEHEVISLDKQHPIKHASRVEIKVGALLKDRKSSLSKSSIGSSDNPGCDPENTNLLANKGASKIRKGTNIVQITSNKRNSSNVSKTTSSGRLQDSSNLMLKWGGKVATTKRDYRDSKAKILLSTAPRKPVWSHNVAGPLKERVTTKSKNDVSSSKFNRAAGGGGKENNAQGMSQNKKASAQSAFVKDGTGPTDLKGKTKAKTQGRNVSNVVNRLHFR
ncbi:hypothetical protein AAC387_Pa01g2089 [Persea americana]